MSTINAYDVLGISPDCAQKDIQTAYKNLARQYHPDKNPGNDELYQLICEAYDKLRTTQKRKKYDTEIFNVVTSTTSTINHAKLKESFKQYIHSNIEEFDLAEYSKYKNKDHTQNTNMFPSNNIGSMETVYKQKENIFTKRNIEQDNKIDYNRKDTSKIDEKIANQIFDDYKLIRNDDIIEYSGERIFDAEEFNPDEFNAIYDIMYTEKTENNQQLTNVNNSVPSGWGNFGDREMLLDCANYNDIYNNQTCFYEPNNMTFDNDMENSVYATINTHQQKYPAQINKSRIKTLEQDINDRMMYIQKNKNKKMSAEELATKAANIENEMKELMTKKSFFDYNTDSLCGGYAIMPNVIPSGKMKATDSNVALQKLLESRKK